jgi:putative NIF3 family GTP cyclohydrolase 1 type 2
MSMDAQQIMKVALELAGFQSIPADSEIHVKGSGKIRKALVAIDVGIGELLLAKQLGCDAVIAHHPAGGQARLNGYKVFERHVDQMVEAGVPRKMAEEAIQNKMNSLELTHHSDNYDQVPIAAKKLGLSLMSIHSPCDEMGRQLVVKHVKNIHPTATVNDLIQQIIKLTEYYNAESKIKIRLGASNNKVGKITFSHAAYTNGGYEVARAYYDYGTETLMYIHVGENDLARLSKEKHGNLIVLGHIASDWVGLNILLSALKSKGIEFETTTELSN